MQVPKYQNTYRMEPQNPFKTDLVDKIVRTVMNNRLDELTYDDTVVAKLCSDIALEIRRRVKKLNFDRCVRIWKLHPRRFTADIPDERGSSFSRRKSYLQKIRMSFFLFFYSLLTKLTCQINCKKKDVIDVNFILQYI